MRVAIDSRRHRSHRSISARGFSLVELMIALTLGLVVSGAVIATFVSIHTASRNTAGIGELADDGRVALDILQQTVRTAGYMACSTTLRQTETPGLNATPLTGDFSEALAGYEAAPGGTDTGPGTAVALPTNPPGDGTAGDWTTSAALGGQLDPSTLATASALPISGSDIIAVHTTYSQVAPVYANAAAGANSVTVVNTGKLTAGSIGVISNCGNSYVDRITGVGAGTVTFAQPIPAFYSFPGGSQVGEVDTVVFYIGTGGDGDGALYSYSLAGNPTFQAPAEVVPDVENMQILYGVDTSGGLAATQYVTADQVPAAVAGNQLCNPGTPPPGPLDFNCVISVKIAILVASPLYATPPPKTAPKFNLLGTIVTAPIDTRMRKVFETTISLRDTTN